MRYSHGVHNFEAHAPSHARSGRGHPRRVFAFKEIFDWEGSAVKVIGMTPEDARASAPVGRNQGLSNGFLAAGAAWAMAEWWLQGPSAGRPPADILRRLRHDRWSIRLGHVSEKRVSDQAGVTRSRRSRRGLAPNFVKHKVALASALLGGVTSNFYLVLTDPDGLAGPGIEQMPGGVGGPYITDPGYKVTVNGTEMTGKQIPGRSSPAG